MTLTRDSVLWVVLFYIGLVAMALSTLTNPAEYGIPLSWMPYIKLVAFIATVVGGKLGLSWLPASSSAGTIARKPMWLLPLLLIPAVGLTTACAAKIKPTLVKFDAASLSAVQTIAQTEKDLSAAGALTPAQSLDIRLKLRPVIELGDKATAALLVWQPGDTTPQALLDLSAGIADLSRTIIGMLPDGGPKAKILAAISLAQIAWEAVIRNMNLGSLPASEAVAAATGGAW